MSVDDLEVELTKMSTCDLVGVLRDMNLLRKNQKCKFCSVFMVEKYFTSSRESIVWRCYNKQCEKYRGRLSIRDGSFYDGLSLPLLKVLKVLLRWALNVPQASICRGMGIDSRTFRKIIHKFIEIVGVFDKRQGKLGGPGVLVEIDETALNHKIKANRGRAPKNKTDALCIVEIEDKITRAFACIIPDKKADTMIPIIVENVEKGSIIWTDEHKSYKRLNSLGYNHDTVCHKKQFVNHETGVNTQSVESFNNELNLEIKRRKGVKTEKRKDFLNEFVWKFNNRHSDRIIKILHLLKIKVIN